MTEELKSLLPGDILAIGITGDCPHGLLRRIETITESNGSIIIETIAATLEEAVNDGVIEIAKTLNPADIISAMALKKGVALQKPLQAQAADAFNINIDNIILYDFDGNPVTTDDQIKADGVVLFETRFEFRVQIKDFQLKQLEFVNTSTERAELEISADIAINVFDEEVEIARFYLTPITIWVGWLPVIISPVITVNVGLDGEVSVNISSNIVQEAELEAGLIFDNGTWSPVSDFSIDFDHDPPTLSSACDFRGYAGPQLSLLIYGVVGPYAEIDGYLELAAYLELLDTLKWMLHTGLEAGVGIKMEIFSTLLADYYAKLIEYRMLVAEGEIDLSQATCYPDLPSPNLIYTGTEDYIGSDGNEYTRYLIEVTNCDDFPDELFYPAPHLPPCGLNPNSSRTWLHIYNNNNCRLYGFCALGSSENMRSIWFAVLKGVTPPSAVYIRLHDRECDIVYTSNLAPIPDTQ
jgi:hypothetical protein